MKTVWNLSADFADAVIFLFLIFLQLNCEENADQQTHKQDPLLFVPFYFLHSKAKLIEGQKGTSPLRVSQEQCPLGRYPRKAYVETPSMASMAPGLQVSRNATWPTRLLISSASTTTFRTRTTARLLALLADQF